jgi:TorA maturation chaperone TorD
VQIIDFILKEQMRGDCYRLLSACFYQPQKEAFIQEALFENLESSLKQTSADASIHASLMGKAFLKCSEEDLLVAYAKLFVGPNELLAPPYGSVYLDGGNLLMGDSTMGVIRMYEEQGLSMDSEFSNLPDHITVELEFMYYLIFKEGEALERSEWNRAFDFRETQRLFSDQYLKRWVRPFCDKIRLDADNEFYAILADCLSVFIEKADLGNDIPYELSARTLQHRSC